jgi:hypothetical protein
MVLVNAYFGQQIHLIVSLMMKNTLNTNKQSVLMIILRLNSWRNSFMTLLLSPRYSPEFPGIPFQEHVSLLLPCLRRKERKGT